MDTAANMNISKNELADVVRTAVDEVLKTHRSVDEETHQAHHAYIQLQLAKEERRVILWGKIKANVYGWTIITGITGIGISVYNYFFKPHG